MPLIPATLSTQLNLFMNAPNFPATEADAALAWSQAVLAYAAVVIPPSTTSAAAQAAMQAGLIGMSAPGAALTLFPTAFMTFATTLGAGMAPLFIAVPPPAPLVLAPAFAIGMSGAPASAVITSLVSIIDLWFRTGTATPALGGPPVPWS